MGYLQLKRLLTMQRESRCHRQALAPDESAASSEKRKGSSYQQDDNPHGSKRMRYSQLDLPEEIWQHIHSLMPMRDAARAACLSSAFLHSWRSHPKLTFSIETLGFVDDTTDFIKRIDCVMKKHLGIGVKALTIQFNQLFRTKACSYLESWLQIAVTPRIEELTIDMFSPRGKSYYNFPCSLLSDESGSSIQHLHLCCCYFCPPADFGCFQSLTKIYLKHVKITGDGLGSLLSTSFALERLELEYCNQIEHIKIPSEVQRLSYIEVSECLRLQVIENKAPNVDSLDIFGQGYCPIQLSFGESSLVKNLSMDCSSALCHAFAELPSIFPNLETLIIDYLDEMFNTPMVPNMFLHLKDLCITLSRETLSPTYDYLSLVSLLDACPSLDTFTLDVSAEHPEGDSIFVNPSDLRQLPEQRHDNLRDVKITGFRSAKSLVELTYYILKNTSVAYLTLDTTSIPYRCSPDEIGSRCFHMSKDALAEAPKAVFAIRTYIEGKVPSTVELTVLEPCSQCHVLEPLSISMLSNGATEMQ
uniref:F-box domain-containing protein n=1 Tax=Leersia perrieri TaxID=77586 RepID=A0A0D9XFI7_9ORYZ